MTCKPPNLNLGQLSPADVEAAIAAANEHNVWKDVRFPFEAADPGAQSQDPDGLTAAARAVLDNATWRFTLKSDTEPI